MIVDIEDSCAAPTTANADPVLHTVHQARREPVSRRASKRKETARAR